MSFVHIIICSSSGNSGTAVREICADAGWGSRTRAGPQWQILVCFQWLHQHCLWSLQEGAFVWRFTFYSDKQLATLVPFHPEKIWFHNLYFHKFFWSRLVINFWNEFLDLKEFIIETPKPNLKFSFSRKQRKSL